jgi:hypothetical protein
MTKRGRSENSNYPFNSNYFLPDITEYPTSTEQKIFFRISGVVPNSSGSLSVNLSEIIQERRKAGG